MSAAPSARGNIEPRGPSLSIGTVGLFVNRLPGSSRIGLPATAGGRPAERLVSAVSRPEASRVREPLLTMAVTLRNSMSSGRVEGDACALRPRRGCEVRHSGWGARAGSGRGAAAGA